MILVVTANAVACRFYNYNKQHAQLTLLKEITHPENKLKISEMTADKSGRYKSDGGGHGAYSPHSDVKDVKIDTFSREVAQELNHERNENEYEKLIIIAPPHMSGLLSEHMNKHVKEMITNNIHKDILHMPDHELLNFLKEHTQFVD